MRTPDRHLLTRFTYGITDDTVAQFERAGGRYEWFEAQVAAATGTPYRGPDWWPDLDRSPASIWQRQVDRVRGSWEVAADHGSRTIVRRIVSPQQLLEVMDEFWQNHFHVPLGADNVGIFRGPFGETVRRHALGRFDQLLPAAVLHPAVLLYLDGATSTKTHPNENLGRELLELYTVGVGSYSEDDVKASARILTGYGLDMWATWVPVYRPERHATGRVDVLGFGHPNAEADGRAVAEAYLRHLAHHPATAARLARKLVAAFVADESHPRLERELARVYLANDTAVVPVLRALIRSPEFAGSVDAKVRDADEDLAATYRALGVVPRRPTEPRKSAALQMYWQHGEVGLTPYGWPRPDGQPVSARHWSTPSRVLGSMGRHWVLAGRWYPDPKLCDYRQPVSWLPAASVTFADLVDHVARSVLRRPAGKRLLAACIEATGYPADRIVTAESDIFGWRWPRLMVTILDSPEFYRR